jgi:hypothetical protein
MVEGKVMRNVANCNSSNHCTVREIWSIIGSLLMVQQWNINVFQVVVLEPCIREASDKVLVIFGARQASSPQSLLNVAIGGVHCDS